MRCAGPAAILDPTGVDAEVVGKRSDQEQERQDQNTTHLSHLLPASTILRAGKFPADVSTPSVPLSRALLRDRYPAHSAREAPEQRRMVALQVQCGCG